VCASRCGRTEVTVHRARGGTPHVLRAPIQAISPFVPSEPWVGYSTPRDMGGAWAMQSTECPHRQAVHSLSDCPVVPMRHNPARHRDPHSTPHVSSPLRRADTAARACAVVAKAATRRQSMGRVTRSTHGYHAGASTITVQRRSGLVHYLPPVARRHDPNAIRRRRGHVERGLFVLTAALLLPGRSTISRHSRRRRLSRRTGVPRGSDGAPPSILPTGCTFHVKPDKATIASSSRAEHRSRAAVRDEPAVPVTLRMIATPEPHRRRRSMNSSTARSTVSPVSRGTVR
jgi:hypothetical protein